MNQKERNEKEMWKAAAHMVMKANEGKPIQPYMPAWATAERLAEQQKNLPTEAKPIPSFKTLGIKAQCYKAILEAHNGEKAAIAARERLGRLLGCAYLLMTESMHLIDEAEHSMNTETKSNMDLMTPLKKINMEFDKFAKSMGDRMSANAMKKFSHDLKAFDENVRSFADLDGYRVSTPESRKESIIARADNLHLDFLDKVMQLREEFGEQACKDYMAHLVELEDGHKKSMNILE